MTENTPILKSHRRPDDLTTTVVAVGDSRFGDGSYPVIAGPAAVESEDQIMRVATTVAEAGASMLRGGTYRAESTPYSYRGLGMSGVWLLQKAGHAVGLPIVTEVIDATDLDEVASHVDLLEVGPENMQNSALLSALGKVGKPVLVHRGPSSTIDEWLMAAEYVLAEGNDNVILCERGSRTFDPRTSDTVDISAIPVVQRISHLPVIIDPSGKGSIDILGPLALAGRSAGADGLTILTHPDPGSSLASGGAEIDLVAFEQLMEQLGIPSLRDEIDRVDRSLLDLVARRLRSSLEIGRIKAERGLAMRSPDREAELIEEARQDARRLGLDPAFAEDLMVTVLDHSRRAQRRATGGPEEEPDA